MIEKSITILMSTYNGEKYVENQILSLLQQTYINWKLIIRDDGSNDKTVGIIRKYALFDDRISLIESNLTNLGAGRSFISLLEYVTSDYIIFCDQDDIWFEKKLEILCSYANDKFDLNMPCMVYCDAYAYSNELGIISHNSIQRLNAKTLREFIFQNSGYQGSSVLFNKKLLLFLKGYDEYFYMHDDLVSLVAFTFGRVFFIQKPLMLYRQHDSNVTGNLVLSKVHIFKNFLKNSYVLNAEHYKEKIVFYKKFEKMMSKDKRKIFEEYLRYPDSNFLERIKIIIFNGFSLGGNKLPLVVKTILRKPIDKLQ